MQALAEQALTVAKERLRVRLVARHRAPGDEDGKVRNVEIATA